MNELIERVSLVSESNNVCVALSANYQGSLFIMIILLIPLPFLVGDLLM